MKDRIGFGIIGAGMIAELHARSMQELSNVRLVGIYDKNAEAARRRAEQFRCKAYENFDAFLADPEIEAVTIATPSGMHGEVAIPAAKAGKHILCEKPLEITLEKVDALIRACDKNNVLLSPVFQTRFTKPVQLVHEAMRSGRFGRMVLASAQMRWYRDPAYYAGSSWRGTWDLDGGGALMNQAIHMIDLLIYINGASVSKLKIPGYPPKSDVFSSTYHLAAGMCANSILPCAAGAIFVSVPSKSAIKRAPFSWLLLLLIKSM